MDRRSRALRACLALLAVTLGGLVFTTRAHATVTTDLNNWNLTESLSQWGGGTQFHISTGGSAVQYRWLDSPNKTTVISANNCTDFGLLGSSSAYGVGDTSYHTLYNGSQGQCFILQGRTGAGQGSMVNHDGRVSR
jgi:hypothetical protein